MFFADERNRSTYSCVDCQGDIYTPWDGELATVDEIHSCAGCEYPVCWDCKVMDEAGNDFCPNCSDKEN